MPSLNHRRVRAHEYRRCLRVSKGRASCAAFGLGEAGVDAVPSGALHPGLRLELHRSAPSARVPLPQRSGGF